MNADDLLARLEGKTLEFKQDASSPEPILKTLSAFSNTAGGVIVIGVQDRTREVVGVADALALEERMMNLASDGIRPQILPEAEVLPYRGQSILAVTVFPGPLRPYYLRREGREQGSYVRVGSSNRRASPELLAELERTARNSAFDEQPLGQLGSADLDLEAARRRFGGRRNLTSHDLETLHLLVRDGRRLVPTVGGILLFGRERLRHFPDARIRLARFAGRDRASIVDRAEAEADLVQAIDDALVFVQRNTATGMVLEGARRRDVPQYPPVAVREAVVNAVAHADYSQSGNPIRVAVFDDRIEIESPGLLPFGITVEDIRRGASKLRNRVIGRVFHELGLIEQWGSGIRRMSSACEALGLPPPELEEIGTSFRVTLAGTRSKVDPRLEGSAGRILEILEDAAGWSTADIAKALEVSTRTARTHLKRLVERGLVVEIGKGPTDPRRVYRRSRGH